ncbi:MAG: tetratricopeptide repeat protein [Spirochaetaceae bacterium]|nr:tetratricopeptide repeat protein [Spirochaetaceae bacterium]
MIFPIIISIIVIGLAFLLVMSFLSEQKKANKPEKKRDRQSIMREANRKLAQDPHNPQALKMLADLYFSEAAWDKAFPLYNLMIDISAAHAEIDPVATGLRYGICAIKMNKAADAFKGLVLAHKFEVNNAEVNYYLGQAFYYSGDYEKASPLFKRTLIVYPTNMEVYRFLGLSLEKGKKYKESLAYLKQSIDNNPEDKEVLFSLAEAFAETNAIERSVKIFTHLRSDPTYGPKSCLQVGILHSNTNSLEKALQDFEIGLKHENVPADIAAEMRYRMAQVYLKMQSISEALNLLKQIQDITPDYKDTKSLILQYQELNQNKNLQTYLIANQSDFILLCKQIVSAYFEKSITRILDITPSNDNTEILAEIDTSKWTDVVLFRFYRTSSIVGELYVRDFHEKIRDTKAGRGICFTAGTFSEESRKFIDGRPIDLIEREELKKFLSGIKASSPEGV